MAFVKIADKNSRGYPTVADEVMPPVEERKARIAQLKQDAKTGKFTVCPTCGAKPDDDGDYAVQSGKTMAERQKEEKDLGLDRRKGYKGD